MPLLDGLDGLRDVPFEVVMVPSGAAASGDVAGLSLTGRDRDGAFGRLPQTEKGAALRELLARAGRAYPEALVQVTVLDAAGAPLASGNAVPRGTPAVSVFE